MLKTVIETYTGDQFFQEPLQLYVNRASESFYNPYHDHDFIELAYVAEGIGFHHTQAESDRSARATQVSKVSKGQFFFLPIGFSHVFRPISSDTQKHPLIVYNCLFRIELAEHLGRFATDAGFRAFLTSICSGSLAHFSIVDGNQRIEQLFLLLHREFSLFRDGSADYLNALLLQLLLEVYRLRRPDTDQEDARRKRVTDFDHLLRYVEQRYDQPLTLAGLSTISGWSERHLQRLFRKHTEQTFHRYMQSLRIQKSCELLKATQLKIHMIAEKVGYRDMGAYLALFKRNMGCTPSEYRKS